MVGLRRSRGDPRPSLSLSSVSLSACVPVSVCLCRAWDLWLLISRPVKGEDLRRVRVYIYIYIYIYNYTRAYIGWASSVAALRDIEREETISLSPMRDVYRVAEGEEQGRQKIYIYIYVYICELIISKWTSSVYVEASLARSSRHLSLSLSRGGRIARDDEFFPDASTLYEGRLRV